MKTIFKFIMSMLLGILFITCSSNGEDPTFEAPSTVQPVPTPTSVDKRENFTFSSNGTSIGGKIFVPSEHETNKSLPTIYLIDFTEQHHKVAIDEFDKVIEGVKGVKGLNALVVTLEEHMDVDLVLPRDFQEYSDIYKNMVSYVDEHYTDNTSRTFIGRGSEASQVLWTLFFEEEETSVFQNFIATDSPSVGLLNSMIINEDFPQEKENRKLHYSFSSDSNRDININLINTINEKAYPWLEFESVEYSALNYENAYPTAFAHGLKFVFEK